VSAVRLTAKSVVRKPGVTLHLQVSETLRGYVREHLKPEEMIPTEAELEKLFTVSRATIRRAIDGLVADGILVRQQGKGTFVASPKLIYDPARIASWTDNIRALGLTPQTRTVQIQEIEPPAWVQEALGLTTAERVIWLWRLRLAGGEPISIMVNYLPARLVPGLVQRGLSRESLYDELREVYRLRLAHAEDEVEAQAATDDEAVLLQVRPGSSILQVRRTTYLADGTPAEAARVRTRADRYRYRATFGATPAEPGRS
jgi:GntR family transcriptional regulator